MLDRYENECCEQHIVHDDAVRTVAMHTPDEDELAELAELFKVFGDSTRIKILYALSQAELCVCDLAQLLGISQPAMSYQLKILRQAKLIRSRRDGKTIFYALADDHVATIIGMAKEHLEE